jgi:hypothetical protein
MSTLCKKVQAYFSIKLPSRKKTDTEWFDEIFYGIWLVDISIVNQLYLLP